MSASSARSAAARPRAGTPQARSVRKVGRRCSKARPAAACTMKSPTRKASAPKAVRFRWKLALSRSMSPRPPGRPDRQPVGEAGRQRPVGVRRPASASARPGRRGRAAARRRRCRRRACRAAGWRSARSAAGRAPPSSRAAVSGAARARSGGSAKARRRSRPAPRPARPSAGSVTGSMPTMRRLSAPWRRSPSMTGETFQPARRSASQSSSAILPPSRASTAARRAAAGDRGGAVVARARLGVQRLHAGPERGRRGEAGEQGDELERVPPPVAEERGEDRGHPSRPACSRTVAPSRAASRALWVAISSAAPASATSASISAEHRVAGRLVEAAGRLVGEDQPRPGGERPADRHPLLLAAGELLGVAVEQAREPEPVGERREAARVVPAGEPRLEGEVAGDVEARDQVELLEDDADRCRGAAPPGRRRRARAERRPGDRDRAAVGVVEAGGEVQERALAAARLAGQRQAGAGGEVERDAVEHRQRPLRGRIALGDVAEAQDGLGHAGNLARGVSSSSPAASACGRRSRARRAGSAAAAGRGRGAPCPRAPCRPCA